MDHNEDVLVGAPTTLSVQEYVEARAKELLSMSKAAITVKGNHQPLQKLPIHMRRRAASHNVKRLPKTLHGWAKREMAKAPPTKNKRPSRKYRRRPSNLLEEYRRRQRLFIWLETHIWHAKRFHMIERWGYKIPHHPNDKGARAAYRATAKYCLLQDMSYHCCVELEGTEDKITAALARLCSPQTGLTFAAKSLCSGRREGRTVIYRHDKYPFGALGEVKFMWRYDVENLPTRHMWIWTHPAMYLDFISELKTVLGVCNDHVKTMNDNVTVSDSSSKSNEEKDIESCSKDDKHEIKTSTETISMKQESFSGMGVTMTSLKDTLCRFHLTGPLANDVLLKSLKVADLHHRNAAEEQSHENTGEAVTECWWKSLFNTSNFGNVCSEIHRKQGAFWETVSSTESPGELEPNCILGLTVRDPRVLLPPKKSMVPYERKRIRCKRMSEMSALPNDVSWSPIWDPSVRNNVKVTKWPDSRINDKRSEALVPGSEVYLDDEESRVPILLIQNPGRRPTPQDHSISRDNNLLHNPGYCSGWDLVVPGGWGMPFLIALVHRGARIAGLKEVHTLAIEEGVPSFPNNYPDTPAGKEWEKSIWKAKQSKYDRVPPAKRCNFAKLGVAAPFHFPWVRLLMDWAMRTESHLDIKSDGNPERTQKAFKDFHVLRSKTQLRKLQSMCAGKSVPKKRSGNTATPPAKKQKQDNCVSEAELLGTSIPFAEQCLVPVQIGAVFRGTPAQFSMICLPSAEDLETFSKDRNWGGPKEPKHKTTKAKKVKRTTKEYINPPELASVSVAGPRQIIGYIKEGSYSFAAGHGYGIGFVALLALRKLLHQSCPSKTNNTPVLLRAMTSSQYRLAYLSILIH